MTPIIIHLREGSDKFVVREVDVVQAVERVGVKGRPGGVETSEVAIQVITREVKPPVLGLGLRVRVEVAIQVIAREVKPP